MKDKIDECSGAARHAISNSRLAADTKVRSEWLQIADAWENLSNGWSELRRAKAEAPDAAPQASAAGDSDGRAHPREPHYQVVSTP